MISKYRACVMASETVGGCRRNGQEAEENKQCFTGQILVISQFLVLSCSFRPINKTQRRLQSVKMNPQSVQH